MTRPILLLTGFLGSGKTTVLARLLRSPTFARTAVIINEFGSIPLDHDMVEGGDETVLTLSSGCLCCLPSTDLANTLRNLDQRRARGEIDFDRVVIETSGLADPVPILHALGTDERLSTLGYSLAGVVTVVDAVAGPSTLERYAEARHQAAMADVLLVSKLDLPDADEAATHTALAEFNATASVMDARVWDGSAEAERTTPRELPRVLRPGPSHRYTTVSITRSRPVPAVAVPLFLEALATHLGARLLRVKGLINIAEAPDQPLAIHVVQHMVHKPQMLSAWPSNDHGTRMVLIGRGIHGPWAEALLAAIEVEVREASALLSTAANPAEKEGVTP